MMSQMEYSEKEKEIIKKQYSLFEPQEVDDEVRKRNKNKIVEIMKGYSKEFF